MSAAELGAKLEYLMGLRDAIRRGEYDAQLCTDREEAASRLDDQIAKGCDLLRQMATKN